MPGKVELALLIKMQPLYMEVPAAEFKALTNQARSSELEFPAAVDQRIVLLLFRDGHSLMDFASEGACGTMKIDCTPTYPCNPLLKRM